MKLYFTPKTLKKIIKLLLLFLLCCFLIYFSNISNVQAYTISNSSLYVCDNGTVKSGYTYDMDGQIYYGDFGTLYNGAISTFSTRFNAEISTGHNYTLEINSYNGDFRNIIDATVIDFVGITSHCSSDTTDYVINSVESSYYKITINFTSNSTNNYSFLTIYNRNYDLITGVNNFKIDNLSLVDHGNVLDSVINNQNANTNAILENQQENTNTIIENQNENSQALQDTIIDNFQNCTETNLITNLFNYHLFDNDRWTVSNRTGDILFVSTGDYTGGSFPIGYRVNLEKDITYTLHSEFINNRNINLQWYVYQNNWGSGLFAYDYVTNDITFTPDKSGYYYIQLWTTGSIFNTWDFALSNISLTTTECVNRLDQQTDAINGLNDSITSSDTSGANSQANSFFSDFENNDFGLSDILTLPLTTIQSITSTTCSPLSLTLPFVNQTFELPCMTTIYSNFEPFYSIYKTITFGIVAYWICVQIYAMVKGFKDPSSDEIEVMDL